MKWFLSSLAEQAQGRETVTVRKKSKQRGRERKKREGGNSGYL